MYTITLLLLEKTSLKRLINHTIPHLDNILKAIIWTLFSLGLLIETKCWKLLWKWRAHTQLVQKTFAVRFLKLLWVKFWSRWYTLSISPYSAELCLICQKIARTVPVFKSGDKNDLHNYRPISILPVFSKVLERVVYSILSDFFRKI